MLFRFSLLPPRSDHRDLNISDDRPHLLLFFLTNASPFVPFSRSSYFGNDYFL